MVNMSQAEPILKQIVQQLLRAGQPQKIILFGSQARGQASAESDYDLLVIENSSVPRHQRAAPYRRALKDLGHPKDILVWTQNEIDEWKMSPMLSLPLPCAKVRYYMKDNRDLARGWLEKARSDLYATERMLDGSGPYDTACFHAQQAIEKH